MQQRAARSIEPVLTLLEAKPTNGSSLDIEISDIAYDSREVKPGSAFCCIEGQTVDGNQFISQAIANGAVCIISEKDNVSCAVPYFRVPDVSLALALIADHVFDHPSRKLRLIGVTGTNGKTTTTHLVEQILTSSGKKVGLIGTLGARWPGQIKYQNIKHTTPQSSDLHRILAAMVETGCTHVAMEVSSHALAQKRVAGCNFAAACLTNITQDHLDFHQTMENYWSSKRRLFEMLNDSSQSPKTAVINIDDPLSSQFLNACKGTKITYGFDKKADIHVKAVNFDFNGTRLVVGTAGGDLDLKLKLIGRFNVYNVMAAIALTLAEGISPTAIKQSLGNFGGVSGRFEVVSAEATQEPLCIVDYAHTPDGLDNVLRTARNVVPTGGKLIVVFGCGGDRDSSKRPQMGEIAEQYADKVIVTSDNPRTEDPQAIIANILAGIKRLNKVVVEPDRATAIHLAVREASNNDVVMVAGKGHENYQLVKDQIIPFDDRTEVRSALSERKQPNASGSAPLAEIDK